MNTFEIQELAMVYAETVLRDGKIGAIMAIRRYGACLIAKERPTLRTVESFYEALKPLLKDEYATTMKHLSSHEQIAVEQAIARRVWQSVQDLLNGYVR